MWCIFSSKFYQNGYTFIYSYWFWCIYLKFWEWMRFSFIIQECVISKELLEFLVDNECMHIVSENDHIIKEWIVICGILNYVIFYTILKEWVNIRDEHRVKSGPTRPDTRKTENRNSENSIPENRTGFFRTGSGSPVFGSGPGFLGIFSWF